MMDKYNGLVSRDEFKHFFDNHIKVLNLVQKNFQDARGTRALLQKAIEQQNQVYAEKIYWLADKIVIKENNELKQKNKKLRFQLKNLKSVSINQGNQ
tara:strand:+ start:4044 stop:4334 length:291 start_codon:yes stop_codon:yes gene_type:complete